MYPRNRFARWPVDSSPQRHCCQALPLRRPQWPPIVMKIKYKGIKSSSDTEIEFKSIDDLYCALIRNGKTEFTIKKSKLNEFMDLFNTYVENPEKQGD